MRKPLVGLVSIAVAVAALGLVFLAAKLRPDQNPASLETVARTPARLVRGEYLVRHVLDCYGCHTARDWKRWGGPWVGPVGAGGDCFDQDDDFPGEICGSNITADRETGIGAWTDGELLRAVREGVDRHGRALFPLMPYTEYRALSEEDVRSVVVYLRGLPPVQNAVPETEIDFPVNLFVRLAPRPLDGPVLEPDPSRPRHYGEYLATVAGCRFCHTPVDARNQPLPGQAFAGGQEIRGPWGAAVSTNLTSHTDGLGGRSRESFIALFRSFRDVGKVALPTTGGNTVMPWFAYAGMTDADLGAIYDYLRVVPPVATPLQEPSRRAAR